MKIFMVSLISFVMGLALAGIVAIKFFVFGGQSVAASEIQFYSNTLQLINSNEIEEIVKRSCFSLPVALENKSQMDNSFFATQMTYGMSYSGDDIESLASEHLSDTGICNRKK